MRFALNSLAVVAGDWLLAHVEEEWLYRYGHRIEESRLPKGRTERQELAETIGKDGAMLLEAIFDVTTPHWLREIPAVEFLRRIWIQNYWYEDGQLHWRSVENIPPSTRSIGSPYDHEARYSKKRSTTWVGYKVHLTETCEKESPHLIPHGATTPATHTDEAMVDSIHADLEQEQFVPSKHLLDSGSITARTLVTSQKDYGIEVIGPTRADYKWQASVFKGFDASHGCRLIGKPNTRPARRGIPASVGHLHLTIEATRSSRSAFLPKIVKSAQVRCNGLTRNDGLRAVY